MDLTTIIQSVIGLMLGAIFWSLRHNSSKLNKLQIDVEVIKKTIEPVSRDHDKIILVEAQLSEAIKDINNAHHKIRLAERSIS